MRGESPGVTGYSGYRGLGSLVWVVVESCASRVEFRPPLSLLPSP
jgi:hypothetical protein